MTKTKETQTLIKDAAKQIFFSKGHINASMGEIAKHAGVNRALIHYYFRSRNVLFNIVLEEGMQGFTSKVRDIFSSDRDLRSKVRAFLDAFIKEMAEFPYLEAFVVSEMARNPKKVRELHPKSVEHLRFLLERQLLSEINRGTLPSIRIDHFVVNLLSLCNYPLISKPVIQTIFGYDENAYIQFLAERKNVIYKAIFNEDCPND